MAVGKTCCTELGGTVDDMVAAQGASHTYAGYVDTSARARNTRFCLYRTDVQLGLFQRSKKLRITRFSA